MNNRMLVAAGVAAVVVVLGLALLSLRPGPSVLLERIVAETNLTACRIHGS